MSKDGSKSPVPENREQRFMSVVYCLSEEFGINDIPEVYSYVELLGQAVARHVFEQNHKMSPQKKVHNDRKRFIAIFKTRYQQLLDLEYSKKITPIEMKLISQTNKKLLEDNFEPDDFLEWLFEDFLVENPKFRPPTVKSICSQFIMHSFISSNQHKREAKKRKKMNDAAGMDLIQRARGLLRSGMSAEDNEKVKDVLKKYSGKSIMLSELRQSVEKLEAVYGRQKK